MLRPVGRATVAYVESKDQNGVRTTLAAWSYGGRFFRRYKNGRANVCIAPGTYINCQTGEVLQEGGPQYEPAYQEEA